MKFILFIVVTVLLVVIVNPYLPYWAIMILLAILAAIVGNKSAGAFFAGGLGMGLAWMGQSIYISSVTGSQLPGKMSELMGLGNEIALFAITGVLGFCLGAFSALAGSLFRKLFKRKPDNIYGR